MKRLIGLPEYMELKPTQRWKTRWLAFTPLEEVGKISNDGEICEFEEEKYG